jgi:hypothetical protein
MEMDNAMFSRTQIIMLTNSFFFFFFVRKHLGDAASWYSGILWTVVTLLYFIYIIIIL